MQPFLPAERLGSLLSLLGRWGELHGPVLTDDGVTAFRPISDPCQLQLDYSRTLIPPKRFLLSPRQTILTYSTDEGYQPPDTATPELVLFGVHPCDLHGIAYLDRVFLEGFVDQTYQRHRHALTLIGLSCEPDEFCFCGAFDRGRPAGCDLFLQRTPDGFFVSSGTTKGDGICEQAADLLTLREPWDSTPRRHPLADAICRGCSANETFPDNPLWNRFAEQCLGCGACSACCPTCYCYDVREFGALDGEAAERLREWDNCLFKSHGEVAGGVNFRRSRLERLQYRFLHKYYGFGPLRGVISCVGCGRCRSVCPVEIDLSALFKGAEDDRQ